MKADIKKTLIKIGNFQMKHWENPGYGIPYAIFIFVLIFSLNGLGMLLALLFTIFMIICIALATEERINNGGN